MSASAILLPVLDETIRLLRDLSVEAEMMAEQLQEIHSREDRGLLIESPIDALKKRILDIKTELSDTAELIPKTHTEFEVPWIGEKTKNLCLEYVSGEDPWKFCLGYKNDREQLQQIENTIKEKLTKGLLQRSSPEVGKFVVCHTKSPDRDEYFRAVIICSYPTRRRSVVVHNLDTGVTSSVFPSEVYCVPEVLAFIPCRVIKCCLLAGEQHLKKKFCLTLRRDFKNFLQCRTLTVDILDKADDSASPRFAAVVWGFNREFGSTDVNLNRFIDDVVIPRLSRMPPSCSDVYEFVLRRGTFAGFYVNENKRKINVAADRRPSKGLKQAKRHASAADYHGSTSLIQEGSDTTIVEVIDEPDAISIAASVEKVVDWINHRDRKVKLPTPEPVVEPTFDYTRRKTVNEPIRGKQSGQKPQDLLLKCRIPAVESTRASASVEETMPKPVEPLTQQALDNKLSTCRTPSVERTRDSARNQIEEIQQESVEQLPSRNSPSLSNLKNSEHSVPNPYRDKEDREKLIESSKLSTFAKEYMPKAAFNPETLPPHFIQVTNYGNDEDNLEEVSNLLDLYQPTDEKRECLFYQKNGYCRRRFCTREHVKKSSLWTTDKVSIYCHTFNHIDVPKEGDVLLTIHHVKNPVSFYATLPESFSDIGESGALETSETLHNDLNSLESSGTHPMLTAGLELGELVLALGRQESLGPRSKWLRGRVTEVLDEAHVEVFFVDFGGQDVVKIKDLREIRPRFLHLPPQAVLTVLSKLMPNPKTKEAATSFVKEAVENKKLKAKVVSSCDDELEVLLFLENGDCLNEILIHKNYAYVSH